jgi:precorrin-6Y C5,15-methyltransferase (decarboxylating)
MTFYIIGITDNPHAWFPPEVTDIIRQGFVFSGGTRHHELVRHLLPEPHIWIDIVVPVEEVFDSYRRYATQPLGMNQPVVVFASGDPLFFGFANTVLRMEPKAEVHVFPAFNSLQMLAHRLLLPYHDMRMVSQTGRPWQPLDEALIRGEKLIGVLTDKTKTPSLIAQRMLEYGYTNYQMSVGERLGNPELERIRRFTLSEAVETSSWLQPCCLILQQTEIRPRPFGIPDSAFSLLDGRRNMITKAPLRLLTLSALELSGRKCMWDVGFCTGSVSIEARLQFPHLHIEAFEVRPEGEELMLSNSRRFGAPGISFHIGDFLLQKLSFLPRPDAVFIGGHGGRLAEVVERIRQYLLPGGIIVFNSVTEESTLLFRQTVGSCEELYVALEGHHPIRIMKKKYEK